MNIFRKSAAELTSQLEAAEAEATTLRAEIEQLKADLAEKDETIAGFVSEKAGLEDLLANEKREKDEAERKAEEAEAKAAEVPELVNKAVVARLAEMGLETPVETNEADTADEPTLVEKLQSLEGAERTKFYNEHKAEILKQLAG